MAKLPATAESYSDITSNTKQNAREPFVSARHVNAAILEAKSHTTCKNFQNLNQGLATNQNVTSNDGKWSQVRKKNVNT